MEMDNDYDASDSDSDEIFSRTSACVKLNSVTVRRRKKRGSCQSKEVSGNTTLTDNVDQETPQDSIVTGCLLSDNDPKFQECSRTSNKTFQETSPGTLVSSQISLCTCESQASVLSQISLCTCESQASVASQISQCTSKSYGISSPTALESWRESSHQIVTNTSVEPTMGPLSKGSPMHRKRPQNAISTPQSPQLSSQLIKCNSSSCHTAPTGLCSSMTAGDKLTCLTRETLANLGDSQNVHSSEEQVPDTPMSLYNENDLPHSISPSKEVSSSSKKAKSGSTKKLSLDKSQLSIKVFRSSGVSKCPAQEAWSGSEVQSKPCQSQEASQFCEGILDEVCSSQLRMLSISEKKVLLGSKSNVPKELKDCEKWRSFRRKHCQTSDSSDNPGNQHKCTRNKKRSSLPAREHSELSDDSDKFPAESLSVTKKQKFGEILPSCSNVKDNFSRSDDQCNTISAPFNKLVTLVSITPNLEELIDSSSRNLVRGFCGGYCLGLSPFEDLSWYERRGQFCPHCPNCNKKGLKEIVILDFWFEALLEDISGILYRTVFSREYAGRFLGCTRDDFLEDEAVRKRVYTKLRSLIDQQNLFDCKMIQVQNVEGIHFRVR